MGEPCTHLPKYLTRVPRGVSHRYVSQWLTSQLPRAITTSTELFQYRHHQTSDTMSVHLSTHEPAAKTIYHRSLPILTKLAKRCQQENPPDPALCRDDYLDYGMAIIGAGAMQLYDKMSKDDLDGSFRDMELRIILKMDTRFEESEERIEKRFRGIDERFQEIDRRFDSLELRMNRKIDALEDRMNLRFEAIDKRFAAVDKQFEVIIERLDHLEGRFDNFQAINRNGKRFKLYHRIEVVRAYKFNPDIGRCQWTVGPEFPKHLKALRNLGNQAKGKWTAEEMADLSPSQSNVPGLFHPSVG